MPAFSHSGRRPTRTPHVPAFSHSGRIPTQSLMCRRLATLGVYRHRRLHTQCYTGISVCRYVGMLAPLGISHIFRYLGHSGLITHVSVSRPPWAYHGYLCISATPGTCTCFGISVLPLANFDTPKQMTIWKYCPMP